MRYLRVELDGTPYFCRWEDELQLSVLDAAPWLGGVPTGQIIERPSARLLPPVMPSKIVCVGRNYAAHAKELGNTVPSEPLLFLKPPSALCTNGDVISLPRQSERVEYEGEVGLVIGERVRKVSPEQALAAVFAVTCVNDVTARDLQKKDVQFTRAKGFDTFCPVGPFLETDFVPSELSLETRVNGVVRQRGHVRDMIFPLPQLVSFISHVMTLEPGDLISTGTPEGVGPMAPGDVVEVEVSGVAALINVVQTQS